MPYAPTKMEATGIQYNTYSCLIGSSSKLFEIQVTASVTEESSGGI
jgi:hypothetical protein